MSSPAIPLLLRALVWSTAVAQEQALAPAQSQEAGSAIERARQGLTQARRERASSPERARALLEEAAWRLTADSAALSDARASEVLWGIGELAFDLGGYDASCSAFEALIDLRERTLGPDHHLVQAARSMLALALKEQGDLERAREIEESVLAVYERVPPPDENQLHKLRMSLAATLGRSGDYAGARPLIEQTLARWEETLAPDDRNLLFGRQYLLNVLTNTGEHREAHRVAEELLAQAEQSLAEGDLVYTLYAVADARTGVGDLAGALELRQRMLSIAERTLPVEHPVRLMGEEAVAISLRELGQLDRARELLEGVLAERLEALPEDSLAIQKSRLALSSTLLLGGDLVPARELAEQALRSLERTLPPEHDEIAGARSYLAQLLRMQGDLVGARLIAERAVEVLESSLPDDHLLLQTAQSVLGTLMHEMGDFQGARVLQEKVLAAQEASWPADHPQLQVSRQELAATLSALGELSAARGLLERALASRERALPAGHPEIAGLRLNLAGMHLDLGEVATAREILEDLERELASRLPPHHPTRIGVAQSLAAALLLQGELARARELESGAIAAMEGLYSPGDPTLQRSRRSLIRILGAAGDEAGRRREIDLLADGLEARIRSSLSLAPREALEAARLAAVDLDLLLSTCFELPPESDLPGRTIALSERLRAVSLTPIVPLALRSRDPEALRLSAEALERRRAVDALVARLESAEPDAQPEPAALAQAVLARDRAESELRRTLGGERPAALEIDVQRLAGALPDGAAALSWRRFTRSSLEAVEGGFTAHEEERLLGVVVRRDGSASLADLGPVAEVEDDVERWRAAVGEPAGRGLGAVAAAAGGADAELDAGLALRRRVLDPLLEKSGEARILVVCPDEALHLVPLDALPLDPPGEPAAPELFGERFEVRCEPSYARLLEPRRPPAAEPVLLVVGGVDFDALAAGAAAPSAPALALRQGSAAAPAFPALPGTLTEVQQVGLAFRRSSGREALLLEGAGATKQELVRRISTASYLHLATHGWFSGSVVDAASRGRSTTWSPIAHEALVRDLAPLTLCGLALAGANRGADDLGRAPGVITAEEFAGLDLSGCELAVLSACETNVGITRAGQGIQSLQAALHAAGARSVITSLWRVPDEETQLLMEEFYERLWSQGATKSRALFEAKLALRDRGHPARDWAGWVLTGDPD